MRILCADEEASPREREGQSIKRVCKDCDKRHTACWSECGEYKAALEEHLARQKKIKAARHNDFMTKDVQYNELRIMLCRTAVPLVEAEETHQEPLHLVEPPLAETETGQLTLF